MPAAYQDENGKWFKQCSKTKEVFGPVNNIEDLSQWFAKNKFKSNGFASQCKEAGIRYNQENADKIREYQKQYNQENADKIKERNRQYRQENADKIKEINRQYYQENADKIKEYYQENADKIKEINRQYRQTAAGLFSKYKKSAKQRGINFTLTLQWFEEQVTKPEFNFCAISGINFVVSSNRNEPFARSLDRISSTKGYTPDNVRWVCYKYNCWKSDLTLEDIARIFKYTAQSHNVDPVEILKQVS